MKSRSAASVEEQFFNFHYEDSTDYDTLLIAPSPCTISYLPTIQGASSVQTEPDSDKRNENCKEPQKHSENQENNKQKPEAQRDACERTPLAESDRTERKDHDSKGGLHGTDSEPGTNATLQRASFTRHDPYTAPWVVARLRDSPQRAIGILRIWAHERRRDIDDGTIDEINALPEEIAIKAVEELKIPRAFVRGTGGTKLNLKTTVVTLDTRQEHTTKALLDSGCEGSCIDTDYVRQRNIRTTPFARPMPVYNADGTRNSAGSIYEYVTLELCIGSHWERIDFGVTNLGSEQIFLGHDWLKRHNPNINWRTNVVSFENCLHHYRFNNFRNRIGRQDVRSP